MAEELPEDFDVIVLGTGFPESVVAAALSRIGMKVLHLDRNDYYSDQWVTFTFESLLKWIELNQNKVDHKEVEHEQEGTGAQPAEASELEAGTYSIPVPRHSSEISNVVIKLFFSENQSQQDSVDPQVISKEVTETDVLKPIAVTTQLEEHKRSSFTEKSDPTVKMEVSQEDSASKDSNAEESTASSRSLEGTEEEITDDQPELENETVGSAESSAVEVPVVENKDAVPSEVDSGDLLQIPFVLPRRERHETKPPIGVNMSYDDLKPYWRQFNIDLAPKVLFSRGPLVEALISANISHYAEFKSVTRILTYMNGLVEEVPCSRADVFSSSVISIVEKRMLMKFLTFCLDFEQQQDQYEGYEDQPYAEFLQSRRLTPNLQHFIIHAIAMVKPETSTLQGLKATQGFLQSLGRYGNTPFIWPLYGAGEMPQAFCRMCAVFGGLYCLRRDASAITINSANNECTGVISNNQLLKCKQLILGHSYVPKRFRNDCKQFVSRAVFITCSSLKPSEEEFISVLSVPPSTPGGGPVRVIELGPATMACPKGLYIVHLVCEGSSSAKEDLEPTANKLFYFPSEGVMTSDKPTALWSLYFDQANPDPSCVNDLPSNVHALLLPGNTLGFGEALQQAKKVFEKICPDEEFLQAVPNPEDIILDDFLQDRNQNAEEEPVGETQNGVVAPGSTDEDSSAAGMVEEQAEGGRVSSEAADGVAEDGAGVKDESLASGAAEERREDDQESKQSNE